MAVNKAKMESVLNWKKKRANILSILIMFSAAYIMLQSTPDQTSYLILGVAFLIAGVYGIIAVYKSEKFIF